MVEQTDVLLFSCVLDVTRFMCANLELRLTPPFHQTSKTVELDYPPPLPPTPSLRMQRVRGVFLCGDAIANAAVQVINGIAAWGGGGGDGNGKATLHLMNNTIQTMYLRKRGVEYK